MVSSPHLVLLYSAPLVWFDKDGQALPIDSLDFSTERDCLFDSFHEAGRALQVRVAPATADNFRTLVTLGCRVLHYSGHGHSDFLAFEDGKGGMHGLDASHLKNLFAAGGARGVQCVFVSACHSRKAGEAFVAAGVPHVIAVRLETPVYDNAARTFARAFYLSLANGDTVRQAFAIGRMAVATDPNLPNPDDETEKFLLLPEYGNHETTIFSNVQQGVWQNVTPPPCPHNVPAIPEHFLGRNVDLQEIIAAVIDKRFVTVRGAPGIGKTTLATVAARYLAERSLFPNGVFFTSLRGTQSTEALRTAIAQTLGIEASNDEQLLKTLRSYRALFVLDNCEDLLHANGSGFRRFLGALLQGAERIKLLLTSRQSVGGALPGVSETVYGLHRLAPEDAMRLFLIHTSAVRTLTSADIQSEHLTVILQILRGHPQAITLAAPQLETKTLARLRADLAGMSIDTLLVAGLPKEEQDAATSLAISLGVSVNYVRERNPDAIRLFGLMGLLPGGALTTDLNNLWGEN